MIPRFVLRNTVVLTHNYAQLTHTHTTGGSWRRQLRSLLSLIDGSNAATHAADSLHSASMGNRSSSHLAPPHHHHQQQQQHAAGLGGKGGLQRSDSGTTMDSSVTGSSVTAPLHRLSGSSAMQRPTSAEMRLHRRQLRWQPPPVDAGPVGAEGEAAAVALVLHKLG